MASNQSNTIRFVERRDTADAAKTEQPRFSIRNCYKLHLNARSHRFSYAKSPISAPRLGQMSLFTRWVSLTGHWLGEFERRKARGANFVPRPRGQVFMAGRSFLDPSRGQWNSDLAADERSNSVGETWSFRWRMAVIRMELEMVSSVARFN